MRVTTKAVFDIETWDLLEWEGFDYDGPVEECKGSNSKQQMQIADQNQAQQTALMKGQLGLSNAAAQAMLQANQGMFGNANALQGYGQNLMGMGTNLMNQEQPAVQSTSQMIANGGFLPGQQQALQAQYMNALGNNYQSGIGQLNSMLNARGLTGGMNAGGGGIGQGFGQLLQAQGQQQQQAIGNVQNIGYNQLQNAIGQGLGMFGQGAGMYNSGAGLFGSGAGLYGQAVGNIGNIAQLYSGLTGTFNQGGANYMNAGVQSANNADQAQTSWMGPVFGAVGAVAGQNPHNIFG